VANIVTNFQPAVSVDIEALAGEAGDLALPLVAHEPDAAVLVAVDGLVSLEPVQDGLERLVVAETTTVESPVGMVRSVIERTGDRSSCSPTAKRLSGTSRRMKRQNSGSCSDGSSNRGSGPKDA